MSNQTNRNQDQTVMYVIFDQYGNRGYAEVQRSQIDEFRAFQRQQGNRVFEMVTYEI